VVTSGNNAADNLGIWVSVSINASAHTLTFDITGALNDLNSGFTLAWAMACAAFALG